MKIIFNRIKFGLIILTALEILDFGINKNAPPRFQYWYEDITFDLRACVDLLVLGIVILLAVKQWNQQTKGSLYLSAAIIYSVLVGIDLYHGAYFIGGNRIYFIMLIIQSLPITIVLTNYLKNKWGLLKRFILLGICLLIGGIIYRLFFVGGLPCPVGESQERLEQGFMKYYRTKTIAACIFALGTLFFQTAVLALIERRINKPAES